MFEQTFKTQLSLITSDKELIEDLWLEIKNAYSKSNRYYHNLAHLNNLESELLPIKDKISDWQTLIFSIAYHDIIYNALKTDNEEKSALLANRRLSTLLIPTDQRNKYISQIRATKGHCLSDDPDTNYFTDADLAILGSDAHAYIEYAKLIRKEYKLYSKDVWELYNLNEDFNEQHDLAKKHPEKLAELKALFDKDAEKYHIYPLISWEDVYQQKFINSKKGGVVQSTTGTGK